jgi:choline dehydrogenase-like flavoprotein
MPGDRYGTKNLHICDSSIYPRMPDTNLMAPTYAVAEFCAELLLKEYSGLY